MKSFRIFLSLAAIVFAVGGAAATVLTDITNRGKILNGSEIFTTVQSNVCDNDISSGTQCTLQTTNTPLAYKVADSSLPLFRP